MLSNKQSIAVAFKRATAYGVSAIETYPGESFTLSLVKQPVIGKVKWFADSDEVLNIKESENSLSAIIKAEKVGKSLVVIKGLTFIHKILVTVKVDKATSLGLTFGKPVPK